MGESSAIEWTDATVNFWWGCTKVGPGCDHCYAESFDKRVGGAHWGTGVPRRQIASAAKTLANLNRAGGKRVFIQSMSDLFDNEVPVEWFAEAWRNICEAQNCRIQIVTKRISAVEKRLSAVSATHWPQHAGLIISVVNQAEADRDIPRLLALKAKLCIPWVGLSMEPLLGPVDLTAIPDRRIAANIMVVQNPLTGRNGLGENTPRLDWAIVGGESGHHARPMEDSWARDILAQCKAAGVPAFVKQMGGKRKPFRPIPDDMLVREFPANA
jgi:protein gp37